MNKKSEFSLDINGMKVAGIAYGESQKAPIIALHGWLDNAASFEFLAEELSDYYVISLDLIGHGKSSHRHSQMPYYIWDNLSDLSLVLQKLNLDKVHLIGHSMGASIAMMFASCFPENVSSLFLIEGIAPLNYPSEELPQLMRRAIIQREKQNSKQLKGYSRFSDMVSARENGRFPVSREAAQLLVARGSVKVENKYYWSSDPALLLPSINRLSEQQIVAFLKQLEVTVNVFIGEGGLLSDLWKSYFAQIKFLKLHTFPGNHHLHMYPEGARRIGRSVVSQLKK